jgi:subfamily B ATP-binding cassette protein MsbA
MSDEVSLRDKISGIYYIAAFKPLLSAIIVGLSVFAAMLEGIGLGFLLPVIEQARGGGGSNQFVEMFVMAYDLIGVPYTLEYIIVGVAIVMGTRYTSSFLVAWARTVLQTKYTRYLQTEAYRGALDARIEYYDQQGSDEILNAIITQANRAASTIQVLVQIVEQSLLTLMYAGISLYLAPVLTVASAVTLGVISLLSRTVLEGGYSLGDRVADANENVQSAVQAGTKGIRDAKLFGLTEELFGNFKSAMKNYEQFSIKFNRNQAAMQNMYQLATAMTVFGLIYVAIRFAAMSLAELAVFLFAMFRLAPRVSNLNNRVYRLEGYLPHLVRTQQFIETLDEAKEPTGGSQPVPSQVTSVVGEDVTFSYPSGEQVLDSLSFEIRREEFVAFVGPSGAGKSTIVSLLTRMYEPDSGRLLANGTPITEFDTEEWRNRVSVVRQHPYIFNDTLRYNLTIGNRDATEAEIRHVCEIAQVSEFLDGLPDGLDTLLGDEGVRLSGGQRQRVAIARALLKDADLLILDEATSNLDSNIEERVHGAIESMDRDYAIMVIAHRLSTVVNADRIYTLEDGHVVEKGTHRELLQNSGTYADLYETQTESITAASQ